MSDQPPADQGPTRDPGRSPDGEREREIIVTDRGGNAGTIIGIVVAVIALVVLLLVLFGTGDDENGVVPDELDVEIELDDGEAPEGDGDPDVDGEADDADGDEAEDGDDGS